MQILKIDSLADLFILKIHSFYSVTQVRNLKNWCILFHNLYYISKWKIFSKYGQVCKYGHHFKYCIPILYIASVLTNLHDPYFSCINAIASYLVFWIHFIPFSSIFRWELKALFKMRMDIPRWWNSDKAVCSRLGKTSKNKEKLN